MKAKPLHEQVLNHYKEIKDLTGFYTDAEQLDALKKMADLAVQLAKQVQTETKS